MFKERPPVTLENVGNGAAVELFNRELEKVMANILDPNTDHKKRKIVLTLEVTPAPNDRTFTTTAIHCKSTLSPANTFQSRMFIGYGGKGNKELIAFESDPDQLILGETPGKADVVPVR